MYVCPGETHPITRSVHLSRLAAFYPGCRDCPLRTDTGQIPQQTIERLHNTERRVERKSLFAVEGVRGVYLNELNRAKAGRIAAALASLLWDELPLAEHGGADESPRRRAAPAIVVGQDERPSSPDIVTGVASALRRMGCQVIDISQASKPCFWFAVAHLEAAAGVYVTGAGCDPSWTGIDFVGRDARPLSQIDVQLGTASPPGASGDMSLNGLESRLAETFGRPTRQAGRHRTFQANIPYEAGLWKHFHALRPVRIVCGCASRFVRETLARLFSTLPCRLDFVDLPVRTRDLFDAGDADVVRMSHAINEAGADTGVLIDDDGSRCAFLDERGRFVPPNVVSQLVAKLMLTEHPGAAIIVESASQPELRDVVTQSGGRRHIGGASYAEMSCAMREQEAVFGGGTSGRYWFNEPIPTHDAILALARVLDVLSLSDAPFSEVAHQRQSEALSE